MPFPPRIPARNRPRDSGEFNYLTFVHLSRRMQLGELRADSGNSPVVFRLPGAS